MNNLSGDKVFTGSDPGERGAAAGMSTTAAQLATGVRFHASRRHSSADGAGVNGC